MPLDVIYGETRHRHIASALAADLSREFHGGTVYLGYPVLATADEQVDIDALFVSPDHGLVAFQIAEDVPTSTAAWDEYVDQQDRLYGVLESQLGRHDSLRRGRRLALEICTITIFGTNPGPPPDGVDGHYIDIVDVISVVQRQSSIERDVYLALEAALQRVTTIKPSKRRTNVKNSTSRGAIMKLIERGIANLDRHQKRAAIETPEGPQRIRGLAGSGKTVVLALKAAYLHAQHPDWTIALTFYSRSLHQQFEDLVTRFSFEHSNDRPDFERLRILHSWGSRWRDGVYSTIAEQLGIPPRDYNYARATFGRSDPFKGVCRELLEVASQSAVEPIFDAVLIDEAQDLPPEFFRLVHMFAREPKRVIFAYDELQRLSEAAMPPLEEMFGTNEAGEPLFDPSEREGEASRDIVLPICYRNTPWALVAAHALGLGIYREGGLVQHLDDPSLWTEIGYEKVSGNLELGSHVILQRAKSSYPSYFTDLLSRDDAVVLKTFSSELEQDTWVAHEVLRNLQQDELEEDDILIVLPDVYTSKRRAARLAQTLAHYGIAAHLVGVGSSVDEVFIRDSVAIAHIYRAKGNEAPMTYVLDAQYASSSYGAITRRNTLFTAITRSRAWVRIAGHSEGILAVARELEAVRRHDFKLDFTIPTSSELARLRRLHRDRTQQGVKRLQRTTQDLEALLGAIDRGEIDAEDLAPGLRARIVARLGEDLDEGGGDETDYA